MASRQFKGKYDSISPLAPCLVSAPEFMRRQTQHSSRTCEIKILAIISSAKAARARAAESRIFASDEQVEVDYYFSSVRAFLLPILLLRKHPKDKKNLFCWWIKCLFTKDNKYTLSRQLRFHSVQH